MLQVYLSMVNLIFLCKHLAITTRNSFTDNALLVHLLHHLDHHIRLLVCMTRKPYFSIHFGDLKAVINIAN